MNVWNAYWFFAVSYYKCWYHGQPNLAQWLPEAQYWRRPDRSFRCNTHAFPQPEKLLIFEPVKCFVQTCMRYLNCEALEARRAMSSIPCRVGNDNNRDYKIDEADLLKKVPDMTAYAPIGLVSHLTDFPNVSNIYIISPEPVPGETKNDIVPN